jgi:hypothetical protein
VGMEADAVLAERHCEQVMDIRLGYRSPDL